MALTSDALDRLPHVDAVLNYLTPMNEKPHNYAYDPPPGVPQTNTSWEPHEMPIHDIRAVAGNFSLDGAGLELVEQESAPRDFVASDLIYRDRTGETYAVTHDPRHRWYYVSAMARHEALLLKCFDSARDGTARFAPHTAFEDPTAPADRPPRESIELRTIAFFGG